jgi:hypothetical protein
MNKATMKWRLALPVAAAVLVLGGCGGSSDNSTDAVVSSSGSITACFTANNVVNFSVTANGPSNQILPNRSVVGPMIYNGQTVTGQKLFYPSGNTTYTRSDYWMVTNNGVTVIALVDYDGTVTNNGTFFQENMNPGQTVINSSNDITTFVGFETITLAGKTFSNVCHFKEADPDGTQTEAWYAPGYGTIQGVSSNNGFNWQYNGDL